MSNTASRSMNVARILDKTAALAFQMEMEEIVPAFDEAEATCLSEASSKEEELEIKRRVAEWKMKLFCDRDAPFEKVDQLYNDVIKLGYSSLEVEGNIEIYFAQYCIRQDRGDVARPLLEQLCSKLDIALESKDLDVYHQLKEDAEKFISRIE